MPKIDSPPIDTLTYEQAFSDLEKVVSALEEGRATLDESVGLFQRGQALVKHCSDLLEKARLKVTILEQSDEAPGEIKG